jgi:ferredoxin
MNEDSTHAFVHKQPQTPEEEQACEDAKASCPSESIGNDGE